MAFAKGRPGNDQDDNVYQDGRVSIKYIYTNIYRDRPSSDHPPPIHGIREGLAEGSTQICCHESISFYWSEQDCTCREVINFKVNMQLIEPLSSTDDVCGMHVYGMHVCGNSS